MKKELEEAVASSQASTPTHHSTITEQEDLAKDQRIKILEDQLKQEQSMKLAAINKLTEVVSKKNPEGGANGDYPTSAGMRNKKPDKISKEAYRRKEKELLKVQEDYKSLLTEHDRQYHKYQELKNDSENTISQLKAELDKEKKFSQEKMKTLVAGSGNGLVSATNGYGQPAHHNSSDNIFHNIIKGSGDEGKMKKGGVSFHQKGQSSLDETGMSHSIGLGFEEKIYFFYRSHHINAL